MDMESEPTERYERWRRFTSIMKTSCQSGLQSIHRLSALMGSLAISAWHVIRTAGQQIWQMRWLVEPLWLPTPGAWIVTTLWAFGVVLLTERVYFPFVRRFLIGGTFYLAFITIIWAIRTCHPKRQRILACLMIAAVGVMAWQGAERIIDRVEAKTFIAVEFKSSPFLKPPRQKYIRRDLTAFHAYLEGIKFDIPKKMPFLLGTTPGRVPVSAATIPGTPYDATTRIPERDIVKDDVIQSSYARFVFDNLLRQREPTRIDFQGKSTGIFLSYYVSSYRGTRHCGEPPGKWCAALWDIRQQYGQNFTDKLLFYTFQQWRPASTNENNFDAYFMSRLFSGIFVAAHDYDEQRSAIGAILKARGLDPEQLPP